ncbi:uncharacterized protein [Magallana gigas]|uniref:uncharacterized protein isoform X1 n=1 Tax=Magallana gigas TaxID=29159 RepID=UPI0033421994
MASRDFADFPDRKLSSEFRGKWKVSLFGCFENPGLSLLTCVLPCYTAARNARAVGDHGVSVGLLYFLFWPYGVFIAAETRRRIRERKAINVEDPGGFGSDCLVHLFCPLCALVQDAQEIQPAAQAESMARE